MNEFGFIAKIQEILGPSATPASGARITKSIGDDAAVIDDRTLFAADCMVEGIHFDLKLMPPEDVGYKAVAACLSDLAAMNGKPTAITLSLALPKDRAEKFIPKFYAGIKKLQAALAPYGVFEVIGGDLSASPGPIFIDVAALGLSTKPVYRSGAREGDIVAVSGHPGTSAAGLFAMQNWQTLREISGALMDAHTKPRPRFDLDVSRATSLIDISDGLASEALHIARASHVHLEIEAAKIPLHERAVALARRANKSALDWALDGGEDYELLATFPVPPGAAGPALPAGFTAIGRVTAPAPLAPAPAAPEPARVTLIQPNGERLDLGLGGFNHFA